MHPHQLLASLIVLAVPALAHAGGSDRVSLPGAPGLALDPARVAILAAGESVEAALAGAGLDPRRAVAWPIEGWWIAELPAALRGEAGARAAVAALAAGGTFAAPVFAGPDGELAFPTPFLLVDAGSGAGAEQALALAGDVRERDFAGLAGVSRLESRARDGFALLAAAQELERHPQVRFAEPDLVFTGHGCAGDGDPLFDDAWALHNTGQAGGLKGFDLDAPQAWDLTSGEPGVHVVVLDVGVQPDHPGLALAPGADFTGEGGAGAPVNPCDNHGTAVAGCISGALGDGLGSAGIAPGSRVASARVFIAQPACDGSWTTQTSWTALALDWAQQIGARVTCNSNVYAVTSATVEMKYAATRAAGIAHVAAAGDGGALGVGWPASLGDVLAVSAVDRFGALAPSSSFGPEIALCAPGAEIPTTDRTGAAGYGAGDYAVLGGSSLAASYAAGVAALAVSRNPWLDAAGVEQALLQGATDLGAPGVDDFFGAGMVDAWETAVLAAPGGATSRVTVSRLGEESNLNSYFPSISADGRYLAFDSWATNLLPGLTSGFIKGFVYDRLTGGLECVTLAPGGLPAAGGAGDLNISPGGRFVAFDAKATNLVPGDTNGASDAFVHDRLTGITERVSVSTAGVQGDHNSIIPGISGDGSLVVFRSRASNLVAGDTNGVDDIFLRDRVAGTTERVSIGNLGEQGNAPSVEPEISADGRIVTFQSLASNLVPGDTAGLVDVFARDLVTGTNERLSVSTAGAEANGSSSNAKTSADGRLIAFESKASNLVAGDTNGARDIFLRDRVAGTTVRLSVSAGGVEANDESKLPWVSGDGRFVAFSSFASNLVPGDTNGVADAFVVELATGAIQRVSLSSAGVEQQGLFNGATQITISHDGRFVGFESLAAGLVPDVANGLYDIYVHDRMTAGEWFDLGQPLPGSGGTPELTGTGGFGPGSKTKFVASNAPPSGVGVLVLGVQELYVPFLGGVLVPSTHVYVLVIAGADGVVAQTLPWAAGFPGGIEGRVQAWFLDPAAPSGFSATNALGAKSF
jgi:Tol biopolymer transport system component